MLALRYWITMESANGKVSTEVGWSALGCRRIAAIATAVMVSLLLVPSAQPPAKAWSNGLRKEPDSFGTHDWVLLKAVKAVGNKGRWVKVEVALHATDDPDSVRDIRFASDHRWHNWGLYRGTRGNAPKAVRIWYETNRSASRARTA